MKLSRAFYLLEAANLKHAEADGRAVADLRAAMRDLLEREVKMLVSGLGAELEFIDSGKKLRFVSGRMGAEDRT